MESISTLISPVLALIIMSVGVMMIFGVSADRTLGFWNRLLLQPLLKLLAWPFRWLGRQIENAANQAANALGRLLVRSLQIAGWISCWPVRLLGWFVWEQTRMAFQDRSRFRARQAPRVIPPRRRPHGHGRRP